MVWFARIKLNLKWLQDICHPLNLKNPLIIK